MIEPELLSPRELEELAGLRREAARLRPCAWRSAGQLASCVIPALALWRGMLWAGLEHAWLTVTLASGCGLLMVRLFAIFHDLAHATGFERRMLNEVLGVLVGCVLLTPYHRWRRDHARHHAGVGNLDRRGPGDVPLLTVDEHARASGWARLSYRVFRWPPFTFVGGGLLLFFVLMRRPGGPTASASERAGVQLTTLGAAALLGMALWQLGPALFGITVVPMYVVLCGVVMWLYNIQHLFPGAYLRRAPAWSHVRGCLEGSSYYRLPHVLRWITGNTGFHHLHHLFPGVPNYFLPRCQAMLDRLEVGRRAPPVTLRSSMQVLRWALYDEPCGVFVPLPERTRAGRSPRAATDELETGRAS